MLKHMSGKHLIAGFLIIAYAIGTQAAGGNGTATFTVSGTINPAACNVSLSAGGNVSYGNMTQGQVQADPVVSGNAAYNLGAQQLPYSITCQAPTKVAMSFTDNYAGNALTLGDGLDFARYGLVDTNNLNSGTVGAYDVNMLGGGQPSVDGQSGADQFLFAPNGNYNSWSVTVNSYPEYAVPGYTLGVNSSHTSDVPISFTTLSGTMNITTYISKSYVDQASSSIKFSGSGTITLVYL